VQSIMERPSIMERAALDELRKTADPPPAAATRGQGNAVATHPSALDVEYWQEDANTWSAFSPDLGLSATAGTPAELFAQMGEAVEEYWDILNERYNTLSDELRARLDLRYLALNFKHRAA
jgi:hypothetical protein